MSKELITVIQCSNFGFQISRSNLDGSQPEPLPILTMAREIAIDSVNAYLYYATSHSVERSRLNGQDHFVYMQNALFSGKHGNTLKTLLNLA